MCKKVHLAGWGFFCNFLCWWFVFLCCFGFFLWGGKWFCLFGHGGWLVGCFSPSTVISILASKYLTWEISNEITFFYIVEVHFRSCLWHKCLISRTCSNLYVDFELLKGEKSNAVVCGLSIWK